MAWTGVDDFDSYTTGADLNTLSGGSGWNTAWVKESGGAMTIETAPAGGQGGKAIRSQSATVDTKYLRTIATSGTNIATFSFRARISITNPNDFVGLTLTNASNTQIFFKFGSTGNFEGYDGAAYQSFGAYAADTWYTIDIDWDMVAQPDKWRARINGGTYSAYINVNGGAVSVLHDLRFDDSAINAHTVWFDDIGLLGSTGPAPETRTITMVRGG